MTNTFRKSNLKPVVVKKGSEYKVTKCINVFVHVDRFGRAPVCIDGEPFGFDTFVLMGSLEFWTEGSFVSETKSVTHIASPSVRTLFGQNS